MQFAKDSFYTTLRDRLALVNPGRTVVVNGASRPAVIVPENEAAAAAEPLMEAFYLYWGAARMVKRNTGRPQPLMVMECSVSYRSGGSSESGHDRGRIMGTLDHELMRISRPGWAPKQDYSQTPAVDLGTRIFWNDPDFHELEVLGDTVPTTWRKQRPAQGARLLRVANFTVFFFAEVQPA